MQITSALTARELWAIFAPATHTMQARVRRRMAAAGRRRETGHVNAQGSQGQTACGRLGGDRRRPADRRRILRVGQQPCGRAGGHGPTRGRDGNAGPGGHVGESRARRRLLLGRAGRVPACQGRAQRRVGLRRRQPGYRQLPAGQQRPDRPRRIRRDHVRSAADQLCDHPADLFLGGPRPDPAQSPGAGHGHAVPLGDLRRRRCAGAGRPGLCRPARRCRMSSSARSRPASPPSTASTPPRPIIRTTPRCIPTTGTSPTTTCRRSRT